MGVRIRLDSRHCSNFGGGLGGVSDCGVQVDAMSKMEVSFRFTKDELLKALWWNGDSMGLIGGELSGQTEHGWLIDEAHWDGSADEFFIALKQGD